MGSRSRRESAVGAPALGQTPAGARVVSAGRHLVRRPEFGVLVALVAVMAAFTAMQPRFLSATTFGDILTVAAEVGVVATGVTFLMIAGEFDLSVGSNFALSAMILAILLTRYAWNPVAALLVALAFGTLVGLVNGLVTLWTGIPSFITTLGTLMLWRGVGLYLTGGWPVSVLEPMPIVDALGGASVAGTLHVSALWWLLLSAAFWLVLQYTRYGNWVFATGGKAPAARAMGVPVRRVKLLNFALAGTMAATGGFLQFGRMGSMSPVWGTGLELEAIASAVIGGTSLSGGVGTIAGTMLGAITMAAIRTGLVMIGAPAYWYQAFVGVVLVLAVILNTRIQSFKGWGRR